MLSILELVKNFAVKSGEPVRAVDGVSLEVDDGELFTLLGPSGCGKTTTLRSIAGLERPDSGHIQLADRVLFSSKQGINIPAHSRHTGMVFQSYAIWPHLSVFENVAFPLRTGPRQKRPGRTELRRLVMEALEKVELAALSDRPSTNLSGGQQQRLALARALIRNSGLLLLDEPLSNLDAKLRESMRFELKRLQREFGITTVYVTHDQTEALGLSSRLAVMNKGRVMQVGRPREIYEHPANEFVADFVGTSNFVKCIVESSSRQGMYRVSTKAGSLYVSGQDGFPLGGQATVSIRPEQIEIREQHDESRKQLEFEGPTEVNEIAGRIVGRQYLGDRVEYIVDSADLTLKVRCNPSLRIRSGTPVSLTISSVHCILVTN